MPRRAATIESRPMAFAMVAAVQAEELERGDGHCPLGRRALVEIIEGRMAAAVDRWFDRLGGSAVRDRRNDTYRHHRLSAPGTIERAGKGGVEPGRHLGVAISVRAHPVGSAR